METTTIQIDKALKEKLESIKLHQRETFNELISRIIDNDSLENASRESLIATIEVMSDPELVKGIAKSLQEYERGEGTSLENFKKELKINV